MKEEKKSFYHYPAKHGRFKGQNVVTVCVIKDEGGFFYRGVSVCSPSDIPDDIEGEKWAYRYARHALLGRSEVPIVSLPAIRMLLKTDCPFTMQSEEFPFLTFQEIARFFGKKNYNKIQAWNKKQNDNQDIPILIHRGGL